MTLVNLRTEVDTRLAALWPNVVTRQTSYFNAHSRYWQGTWSVPSIPAAVTADAGYPDTPTDDTTVIPSEVGGWNQVTGFPALMCYRVRMDVWEDPEKGFTGVVQVRFNGQLYERSKSFPDDRYTSPWTARKDP